MSSRVHARMRRCPAHGAPSAFSADASAPIVSEEEQQRIVERFGTQYARARSSRWTLAECTRVAPRAAARPLPATRIASYSTERLTRARLLLQQLSAVLEPTPQEKFVLWGLQQPLEWFDGSLARGTPSLFSMVAHELDLQYAPPYPSLRVAPTHHRAARRTPDASRWLAPRAWQPLKALLARKRYFVGWSRCVKLLGALPRPRPSAGSPCRSGRALRHARRASGKPWTPCAQ